MVGATVADDKRAAPGVVAMSDPARPDIGDIVAAITGGLLFLAGMASMFVGFIMLIFGGVHWLRYGVTGHSPLDAYVRLRTGWIGLDQILAWITAQSLPGVLLGGGGLAILIGGLIMNAPEFRTRSR